MKRTVVALTIGALCLCNGITAKAQTFTEEEKELIALVTYAEAEGEPEIGQRMVIDTILNRVDHDEFPDDIKGVIYEKNQFSCITNGRIEKSIVTEDIYELVEREIKCRHNNKALFFARSYGIGEPLLKVGNHYFTTLEGV